MTTRAYRRPRAAVAVLALAFPLSSALIGATATPALAAQSLTVSLSGVSNNGTATQDVMVKGTITNTDGTSSGGSIVIDGPADFGSPARGYNATPSITSCSSNLVSSCSKTASFTITLDKLRSYVNGKWTAKTCDDAANNCTSPVAFYTNFGPTTTPSSVSAQSTGASRVDVQWSYSGQETDLTGFEISDGKGSTFNAGPSDRSYTAYYDNPTPGTYDYRYTVRALRKSGTGGSDLASEWSNTAGAQLVTPQPPPSPTPTPTGGTTGGTTGSGSGGTTGSSTGGTTAGGTTGTTGGATGTSTGATGTSSGSVTRPITIPTLPPIAASRRAFALSFNRFSPSLGIPKLPPLPATTFPVTAPGSEVYQPTLPYADQPGKTTTKVLSSPVASLTNSIDTAQLAKSLAVALILLVAAAHVRIFLSHSTED